MHRQVELEEIKKERNIWNSKSQSSLINHLAFRMNNY